MYEYYGAGQYVPVKNKIYPDISSPDELYEALSLAWSRETCTERLRDKWSSENKTCGQCAITAFIFQDIFGGEIYEMKTSPEGIHCYNAVDGKIFDLTSEQFGPRARELVYDLSIKQDRALRLSVESKRARYEALKTALF